MPAMVGKTLYDKIWDAHVVEEQDGETILYIDLHLIHEVTTPQAFAEQHIVLEDAPWVRDHVSASHGLAKLSSYLDQPRLSLRMALDTYLEVFTGA